MARYRDISKEYVALPEWTFKGCTKDAISLATAIALAGLEGEFIRLTAKQQTEILGFPAFGKKLIKFKDNMFYTFRKVAFGGDFDAVKLTASDVRKAITLKKDVIYTDYSQPC